MRLNELKELCKVVRYYILKSTTNAGSGHPSSSLSAVELMVALMFGGFFKYDAENPSYHNNDRIIFSKGHASPLLYSLWVCAGTVREDELMTYRKFGSRLEGHPSMDFPFTEAPTGSLGQGLSIGVGMAINAKYLDKTFHRVFVLLGDGETSEGQVWEAAQIASYYKLNNLMAIIDVNRLGQSGETMLGRDLKTYANRFKSFGWHPIIVRNGHDLKQIIRSYDKGFKIKDKPVAIIANTVKGKGVSFMEDKNGWHGKALTTEQLNKALKELGSVNTKIKGKILKPSKKKVKQERVVVKSFKTFKKGELIATRKAYGNALIRIHPKFKELVVLDADVKNSTYSKDFQTAYPNRFFEMFIAEQNMVSTGLGLALRGKKPFISTFAAFLSRAYDQIRMCEYAKVNINFVGSHAGVSIGQDGPSQMGLNDLSFFRSLLNSVVFYPSDAVCMDKVVELAAKHDGITYIRSSRLDTPVIYSNNEKFRIGGSKVLKKSNKDEVTIISAGVTLHEALKAYELLKKEGLLVRVVDLYCVKPIDEETIKKCAGETNAIITVEDHFKEGGIGEAVETALANTNSCERIVKLAVTRIPESGDPMKQLSYEGISSDNIVRVVKKLVGV